MSSAVAMPVPDGAVQTTPTSAAPTPAPVVQPRNPDGTFAAPQATPEPVQTPAAPSAPAGPFSQEDIGNGRLRVKYETGETFEGTPAEIIAKTAEAHVNTKRWAQQQRQVTPQPVPVQAPAPQSPFSTPEEKAAADQLLDLTAKSLGMRDGNELKERMGFITQTTESAATRDLSIQFMTSQPDYNPTQENSEKLAGIISTMVDSDEAWGRMPVQRQLAIMKAAHAMAIQNKVYAPAQAQPAQVTTGPTPPPPIPTQNAPRDAYSGVPQELIPNINDTQAVILQKIAKLKEMGIYQ